jgi:PEP-CTERM/exosortase A-associated glycosyltransferase
MRVLHLLHRFVPATNGYAIRSREIINKQLAKGLEPLVVTSPSQAPQGELDAERSEYIEGVRYFRTCNDILPPTREIHETHSSTAPLRLLQNVALITTALRIARTYRPAVIHRHSPFTCGHVADMAGRWKKVPSIYEMRGIWEDSNPDRYKTTEGSLRYLGVRFLETWALRAADLCFVICEGLRPEITARGISEDKIVVVPNGVNTRRFVPGPIDKDLQRSLGLEGKVVMGFIGSFLHYEGLNLLLEVMIRIVPELPELQLLMIGDGDTMPVLKKRASEAGMLDRVVFTGRVPPKEITNYYPLFDFMVLPRLDTRETRLVTPLKPLEIMAMAKPLIASDIGGHREIVEENLNGLLFRSEDVSDLASKCADLARNESLRLDLGHRAREWVVAHRNWNVLIDTYLAVYGKLTRKEK